MKILFIFIMTTLTGINHKWDTVDKSTVSSLDLNRYLGKWYEIARFDHSFERNLVGTTAYYSLNDDGTIRVVNSGYKDSLTGKFKEAIGKARRKDTIHQGVLEVSFFWNFYSDYLVLELDSVNYSYALVGSKSDKYLWILSRTPQMNQKDIFFLWNRIRERGYDPDELIWVEQPEN